MKPRWIVAVVLAVSLALIAPMLMHRAPSQAQDAAPKPKSAPAHRTLIGTASCSASVCHGGSDLGKPLSEATTWQALDPHGRAYHTLLSDQSQAIAKHLWGDKKQAHDASLCLKCHVHPDYDQARPNFRKADGVGCESCHGAAQDWLTPHYRGDKRGMADSKSLYGRATICAKCHVGTPDANVDHDLIAAGHPALRFEFATYFANLPPHWDVAKDKRANSTDAGKVIDFEARAWAIGQIITSASALDLLAHRADPAGGKPWPELAEFDCFSCHHDLQGGTWRQHKKHLGERRPGSLAWNNWHFAALNTALMILSPFKEPSFFWDFRSSSKNRGEVAKQAGRAAKSLREWAIQPRPAPNLFSLRYLLSLPGTQNWDDATQRLLGLHALKATHRDNQQPNDAELDRLIAALREEVTFPTGFHGPRPSERKK